MGASFPPPPSVQRGFDFSRRGTPFYIRSWDSVDLVTNGRADWHGADDITALGKAAIESGYNRLTIPDGTFLIAGAGSDAGGISAVITRSVHIICSRNTILKAGTNLDNDMVRISVPSNGAGLPTGGVSIIWEGGLFDQRLQRNSTVVPYGGLTDPYPRANPGNSSTCDGLSLRPSWSTGSLVSFTGSVSGTVMTVDTVQSGGSLIVGQEIHGAGTGFGVVISSFGTGTGGSGTYNLSSALSIPGPAALQAFAITHDAGNEIRVLGTGFLGHDSHWQNAGGDSGVFTGRGGRKYEVDVNPKGSRDSGHYGSGMVNADIRGTFDACFYGQTIKRNSTDVRASGTYRGCVIGQVVTKVNTPPCYGVSLTGTYDKCQQAARLDYTTDATLSGMTVRNAGAADASGQALHSSLKTPAAVLLNGSSRNLICHNTMVGFNAAVTTKDQVIAFLLAKDSPTEVGDVSSTYNTIFCNVVDGIDHIAGETSGQADHNAFLFNRSPNCNSDGPIISGTGSTEIRTQDDGRSYFRSGIVLPSGTSSISGAARFGADNTGLNSSTNKMFFQIGGVEYFSTVNSGARSKRSVLAKTTAYTIAATEYDTTFTNTGASARVDITLVAAAVGTEEHFYVDDADGIRVIASGSDTIRIAASVSTAGGYAESTTIGSFLTLRCIASGKWVAVFHEGTWTTG